MKRHRPTPGGVGGRAESWQQEPQDVFDEMSQDVTQDELREFLEADDLDVVEADPLFRERLRRKLWGIIRDRRGPGSGEPN